ncbi:MAG: hypothetical protein H6R13_74 [Proteobacteria bacterium]|nr:hypothetical protein [Pseudomonadota bacterium]
MRASFLLPLLALPSLCWAADPCDELPIPSVTVKRLEERITYNTTYGFRSLTNLGASQNRPGRQVLGLTRGNATVSFASNSPAIIDPSGRWECASPQITMTFGFTPVTVYVAKEFPQGTCAYKEIHEHEMRHFKTYQDHMASIEKALNETLSNRFATGKVWRGPAGQTAALLKKELDERWLPYVQREIQKVEAAQALIDTSEEYERVADACDGEIKKRLR